MPRKAKEELKELNKTKTTQKSAKTKATTKSKIAEKTDSVVKVKTTTKSKVTTETNAKSKSVAKSTAKTTNKTTAKSKLNTAPESLPVIATEYYDLPFRYNQTVVKILAQTPNILFIYWDISDADRKSYIQKYGNDFFEHTRPYLIITNETMNYSFEVEINDFANSWYLHVNDADCEYKVELCRKFIVSSSNSNVVIDSSKDAQIEFESYQINDYLYITSSNKLEIPNNRILFDKLGSSVFFRNTKTNVTEEKNISSISFLQKIGKVYNIYDLYKEIYKDEIISDEFGLNLPSSNSSTFK